MKDHVNIWGNFGDDKLKLKDSEIQSMKSSVDELRRNLKGAEAIIKAYGNLNQLPFSAGIPSSDPSSKSIIQALQTEVSEANTEMTVLRGWNRQLDEALNEEMNTANAGNAPTEQFSHQPPQLGQRLANLLRDVDRKIAEERREQGFDVPNGDAPPDPYGPSGPSGPPGPPGLPSVRGSQRDSAPDDTSTTAFTAIEPPRVSRREADKVNISAWPKHQNLGIWTSDLIKSVCLAANDGDRAAWEAWLQPAIRVDPDLDALNDSDGQRFQSIDAKLSIALSNVVTQAGDAARHVAMKLRLRTQAHCKRGTYVMGREILAMILNHFRTPGQRETAFTMEHIIKSQYLGDANIEVFYEKWMEMVTNMMPEDVPPDDWLRDVLHKKIRNSHLLIFDII
jgi:hypothetical protein